MSERSSPGWYIYGAGGLGIEIADIVLSYLKDNDTQKDVFFIDDFLEEKKVYDLDVLKLSEIAGQNASVTIATGEPNVRVLLREKVQKAGHHLKSVVDPTARLSPTAQIMEGVIISPFCSVSSLAKIEVNSTINTMSIVGHDVSIGKDSSISSMVNLGGGVKVGDRAYIGMGALVKEGINIGDDVIIGMGSVVYKDIPDGMIALGNPARVVKKNEDKTVFK